MNPIPAVLFIVAIVALGVAAAVFFGLRHLGWRRSAWPGSVLAALVAAALIPVPVHGGFVLSGQVAWRELREALDTRRETQARIVRLRPARFAGALAYTDAGRADGRWVRVRAEAGEAWLETRSGLIFGPSEAWSDQAGWPDVDAASRACAERLPRGYWSLPDAAEMLLFDQAEGERVAPSRREGRIAVAWDADTAMNLPQIALGPASGFALRCVARSDTAPENGYQPDDIPLADWNAYQLRALQRR